MLTVFINEGIKMDKCPKNMTLVALNIFGLITILDFFQDTFVSIFKTKRPSDYFAFSLSCFVEGKLIFTFLYLVSWVAPLAVGHIFFFFFFVVLVQEFPLWKMPESSDR